MESKYIFFIPYLRDIVLLSYYVSVGLLLAIEKTLDLGRETLYDTWLRSPTNRGRFRSKGYVPFKEREASFAFNYRNEQRSMLLQNTLMIKDLYCACAHTHNTSVFQLRVFVFVSTFFFIKKAGKRVSGLSDVKQ